MTTTPESWEQQLHDAANAIDDTGDTEGQPDSLREKVFHALYAEISPLLREFDEARLELTRWQTALGDPDAVQARLDGAEAVRQALADHITGLYEALGWHEDTDHDDAYTKADELIRQRSALWQLLKQQTRQARIWRRRANTTLTEAVEQTAHDMQRAGQLRRERDEARAEVERLRAELHRAHLYVGEKTIAALTEPTTDPNTEGNDHV